MAALRKRPPSVLELRAYHEAGHAVAALLRGFALSRVTIARRGNVGGACEYRFCGREARTVAARRRLARAGVAVAIAGSVAQDAFAAQRGWVAVSARTGAPTRPFAPGAEDDARVARRFARLVHRTPDAQRAFVDRMRSTTEALLLRPEAWTAVRGLARALQRRPTLCGECALDSVLRALASAGVRIVDRRRPASPRRDHRGPRRVAPMRRR